jgi:hypothetical protein
MKRFYVFASGALTRNSPCFGGGYTQALLRRVLRKSCSRVPDPSYMPCALRVRGWRLLRSQSREVRPASARSGTLSHSGAIVRDSIRSPVGYCMGFFH